ncbi:RDD family protein [Streptomyces sp. 7N604]|uniref:RDD family protein n=1 Tax=Streptomyces sp. 7N604 TaxID=3457415 RepID=UPI003FD4DA5B
MSQPPPYSIDPRSPLTQYPASSLEGPPQEAVPNPLRRLVARLLDGILMVAGWAAIGLLAAIVQKVGPDAIPYQATIAIVAILGAIAVLVYEPVTTARYGCTLGKHAMGLRVTRIRDGRSLTMSASMGRWAVHIVLGFVPFGGLLNPLWCLWDAPYRQCLHDKAVGSAVIKAGFMPGQLR